MEKSPDAFRTISEVSEWLDTPAHVLRFWESRFTQLRPVKRAGGRRYYRPADMALLSGIKKLLHDDGVTIRGVQKILREQGVRYVATLHPAARDLGGRDLGALVDLPLATDPAPVMRFERWKPDAVPDAGATDGAAEAPMHVDAEERDYPKPGAGALHTLVPKADLASGAALLLDEEGTGPELRELQTSDFNAEERALTEKDLTIPPDLEEEWAALLAEEAANRLTTPASPLLTASGVPLQPDLFAAAIVPLPVTFSLPALLPEGGVALPTPVAVLLRQVDPADYPTDSGPFAALLQRLEALHQRLAEADSAALP